MHRSQTRFRSDRHLRCLSNPATPLVPCGLEAIFPRNGGGPVSTLGASSNLGLIGCFEVNSTVYQTVSNTSSRG